MDLLRLVSIGYSDVKITRLLSHVLGNVTLDETSHKEIIHKGTYASSVDHCQLFERVPENSMQIELTSYFTQNDPTSFPLINTQVG